MLFRLFVQYSSVGNFEKLQKSTFDSDPVTATLSEIKLKYSLLSLLVLLVCTNTAELAHRILNRGLFKF